MFVQRIEPKNYFQMHHLSVEKHIFLHDAEKLELNLVFSSGKIHYNFTSTYYYFMNCRYMYILEFGFVKIVLITIAIYFPAVSWNSCDSGFDKGAEKLSDNILIAPSMFIWSRLVKWIRITYFISIRYDVVFTQNYFHWPFSMYQ